MRVEHTRYGTDVSLGSDGRAWQCGGAIQGIGAPWTSMWTEWPTAIALYFPAIPLNSARHCPYGTAPEGPDAQNGITPSTSRQVVWHRVRKTDLVYRGVLPTPHSHVLSMQSNQAFSGAGGILRVSWRSIRSAGPSRGRRSGLRDRWRARVPDPAFPPDVRLTTGLFVSG